MQEIIATRQGKIRGLPVDGVMAFLGVPYAAAPTGPALFRAPAPAPSWDGVRDAVTLGPTVPRPPYPRRSPSCFWIRSSRATRAST